MKKTCELLPKWRNFTKSGHTDSEDLRPLTAVVVVFIKKIKHLLFNEGAFESRLGVGVRVPGLLLHRQRGLGQQRLEPARLKIQKMFHDLPVRLKWLKNLA